MHQKQCHSLDKIWVQCEPNTTINFKWSCLACNPPPPPPPPPIVGVTLGLVSIMTFVANLLFFNWFIGQKKPIEDEHISSITLVKSIVVSLNWKVVFVFAHACTRACVCVCVCVCHARHAYMHEC